jgi:vacuolar protein sorting-associated protein 35
LCRSLRKLFVFIQESVATLSSYRQEKGFCLYLEAASTADRFAGAVDLESELSSISTELVRQAVALYEEQISDSKIQYRCVAALCGTLLALRVISSADYQSLITKTAQFAAKITNKPDQCHLVALCAHLFYPVGGGRDAMIFSNAQRALECLQRSLKLADACTSMNPAHVSLFVDLLEHYVYFFEKRNPLITHAYITGLVALIKEHLGNLNSFGSDGEAKAHLTEVLRYIKQKSVDKDTVELFSQLQIGT